MKISNQLRIFMKTSQPEALTLLDKIWNEHVVAQEPDSPVLLYIDLHLVHEVTSPQAFSGLRERGLKVRQPQRTCATMDHSTPTVNIDQTQSLDAMARIQLQQLRDNCEEHGINLHELGSETHGIVHVIAPELGLVTPGMTIVCGDSHTATHGAFGCLAFGIGTSEVEHVLASQCLLQNKPKSYEVRVEGDLPFGVSAKDIILALIAKIGTEGGTGHVFEFTGSTICALNMEQRMTICNMSIEAGARAGLIAPDETTFAYLKERPNATKGVVWEKQLDRWKTYKSDQNAVYDQHVLIDATQLQPMVTYGTNPGMGIFVNELITDPLQETNPEKQQSLQKALKYMDLDPDSSIEGHPIDVVFLGSCTNARISDLRIAAQLLRGRKIAEGVRMLVVPGSQLVKRQAEAEGLDRIFMAAGAEWREAGCSMCIAMNGDQLQPGEYAISTSNRNFEGRQGKGGRTFLASPLTAAASAITGVVTDPRKVMVG
jgi:3-isopropylmalate/(R)-2-methylmalate dehydratase large subunit